MGAGDFYHNFALLGEFEGIAEQVCHDLAQTGAVSLHLLGDGLVDFCHQLQPTAGRAPGKEFSRGFDTFAQVEGDCFQLQFARFDFGEVQNVIDDSQQVVAAGADGGDELQLLFAQRGVQEQACHAHHCVHRRADFVAHIGQEFGLGLVGRFRGLFGPAQFVLHRPAVGDVPVKADDQIPSIHRNDSRRNIHREECAVGAAVGDLEVE